MLLLCFAPASSAKVEKGAPFVEVFSLCGTGIVAAIDVLNKGILYSELKTQMQACTDAACRNATATEQTTCAVAIGFDAAVPTVTLAVLGAILLDHLDLMMDAKPATHVGSLLALIGTSGGLSASIVGLTKSQNTRWIAGTILMAAAEAGAFIATTAAVYIMSTRRR